MNAGEAFDWDNFYSRNNAQIIEGFLDGKTTTPEALFAVFKGVPTDGLSLPDGGLSLEILVNFYSRSLKEWLIRDRGYELHLMSDLVGPKPRIVNLGEIYIDEETHAYIARSYDGKTHEGKLSHDVDLTDLSLKLTNIDLKIQIFDQTFKAEHENHSRENIGNPYPMFLLGTNFIAYDNILADTLLYADKALGMLIDDKLLPLELGRLPRLSEVDTTAYYSPEFSLSDIVADYYPMFNLSMEKDIISMSTRNMAMATPIFMKYQEVVAYFEKQEMPISLLEISCLNKSISAYLKTNDAKNYEQNIKPSDCIGVCRRFNCGNPNYLKRYPGLEKIRSVDIRILLNEGSLLTRSNKKLHTEVETTDIETKLHIHRTIIKYGNGYKINMDDLVFIEKDIHLISKIYKTEKENSLHFDVEMNKGIETPSIKKFSVESGKVKAKKIENKSVLIEFLEKIYNDDFNGKGKHGEAGVFWNYVKKKYVGVSDSPITLMSDFDTEKNGKIDYYDDNSGRKKHIMQQTFMNNMPVIRGD